MRDKKGIEIKKIKKLTSVVDTPKRAIQEINNATQNFIWDGSTSNIAQQTIIQPIKNCDLKLYHFETKVKALKLSWVKKLTCKAPSNWKFLPKPFYNCQNLSAYFNAKHKLLTPKHISIPNFYIEIHNLFMKFFKHGLE